MTTTGHQSTVSRPISEAIKEAERALKRAQELADKCCDSIGCTRPQWKNYHPQEEENTIPEEDTAPQPSIQINDTTNNTAQHHHHHRETLHPVNPADSVVLDTVNATDTDKDKARIVSKKNKKKDTNTAPDNNDNNTINNIINSITDIKDTHIKADPHPSNNNNINLSSKKRKEQTPDVIILDEDDDIDGEIERAEHIISNGSSRSKKHKLLENTTNTDAVIKDEDNTHDDGVIATKKEEISNDNDDTTNDNNDEVQILVSGTESSDTSSLSSDSDSDDDVVIQEVNNNINNAINDDDAPLKATSATILLPPPPSRQQQQPTSTTMKQSPATTTINQQASFKQHNRTTNRIALDDPYEFTDKTAKTKFMRSFTTTTTTNKHPLRNHSPSLNTTTIRKQPPLSTTSLHKTTNTINTNTIHNTTSSSLPMKKKRSVPGLGKTAKERLAKELVQEWTTPSAAAAELKKNAWHNAAMAWRMKNKPTQEEVKKQKAANLQSYRQRVQTSTPADWARMADIDGGDGQQPGSNSGAGSGGGHGGSNNMNGGGGTVGGASMIASLMEEKPSPDASEAEWRSYYKAINHAKAATATTFIQLLRIFKVPASDDISKVKDAYRLAVRMYHPDSNSKDRVWSDGQEKMEAEEIMKIINERKPEELR